jgi:hypothetical protein
MAFIIAQVRVLGVLRLMGTVACARTACYRKFGWVHSRPVSRRGSVAPLSLPTPSVLHPSRPDLTALLPRLIVRTNHWRINPVNPPPPHTEHSQGRLCGGDCGVWYISMEPVQEKQSPHLILLHNSVFLSSIVGA